MNFAHVFTFWVDDEALDWARLQLAVYKVIQGLQMKTLLRKIDMQKRKSTKGKVSQRRASQSSQQPFMV